MYTEQELIFVGDNITHGNNLLLTAFKKAHCVSLKSTCLLSGLFVLEFSPGAPRKRSTPGVLSKWLSSITRVEHAKGRKKAKIAILIDRNFII
jgi:hypothetical protein